MTGVVAAVDLGATSGRVMVGHVGPRELSLRSVARFPNTPVRTIDGLHWNILELYHNVLTGIATAAHEEPDLASVAVDSWAVDYSLMRAGRMLGTPYHYRDGRTGAGLAATHDRVPQDALYAVNGIQVLPINTLYQLAADRIAGSLELADSMLLIPDLVNYWLTGAQFAERTNASTTGLLRVPAGGARASSTGWDDELIERLGLPVRIFPELIDAGTAVGALLPDVRSALGLSQNLSVVAVGSHDTASAVVAVPSTTQNFAYISCGTWGLVGVELEHPVLTEASRLANFTNEIGVEGRVRYLRNVMGLWLLSESVRAWEHAGETIELATLIEQAADVATPVSTFDVNDGRFLAPGNIPARISAWCDEHGVPAPRSRAEFARSVIQSLARAFADAVLDAQRLSGATVDVIHLVGGGSQNALLCQLTADFSGVPVLAGPVEATAMGNVLVQARTLDIVNGSLESLRALVASVFVPARYSPRPIQRNP